MWHTADSLVNADEVAFGIWTRDQLETELGHGTRDWRHRAIVARLIDGDSQAEVARDFGITASTVANHWRRYRDSL